MKINESVKHKKRFMQNKIHKPFNFSECGGVCFYKTQLEVYPIF